jgi:hypothetical protein
VALEGLDMEDIAVMLEWHTQRDRALAREANTPGRLINSAAADGTLKRKKARRPEPMGFYARG